MNKKAVSGVVVTVIMVSLVLVAISIVWGVINNLIETNLAKTEACFNIFEKINLNRKNICYDLATKEFFVSVNVKDIDVEGILVSISGDQKTKSFKIDNTKITDVKNLNDASYGAVELEIPGQNSGLTYIVDISSSGYDITPDSVEIAPIINKNQCDKSDSMKTINEC